MGCDIHIHQEVKINGVWHHYRETGFPRMYGVFAIMAGVRSNGEEQPISLPRGIPQDATEMTKWDCKRWGVDGHSHSYLNAEEILQLEQRIKEKVPDFWPESGWGYLFGNSWGGFTKYPEDRDEGVEDVRFVFWFDN